MIYGKNQALKNVTAQFARGAVGLLVGPGGEPAPAVINRIVWGCGWIEALLRRRSVSLGDRIGTVVELLATGLHHDRFQEAATAVVTELAGVFGCERVSLGFLKGKPEIKRDAETYRGFTLHRCTLHWDLERVGK